MMSISRCLATAILLTSISALAAQAHPHKNETEEPSTADRIVERVLEDVEETRRNLSDTRRKMAEDMDEAWADGEMIESMTDLLEELADQFEVERNEGRGTALLFGGDELLRFQRERSLDDTITISGLGRNLRVERETTTKNGKTKTRIVIEMEGGADLEIDLPETDDDEKELDQE